MTLRVVGGADERPGFHVEEAHGESVVAEAGEGIRVDPARDREVPRRRLEVLPERDDVDAKVWFYLDHREDIEAWARIRPDAKAFVERHLLDIEALVGELAAEVEADAFAAELDAGTWPKVGLRRPSWGDEAGFLGATVTIEWDRSGLLSPVGNTWPYVGVRITPGTIDPSTKANLVLALQPLKQRWNAKATAYWPLWRQVDPRLASSEPMHPASLVEHLLVDVRALWQESAPLIDAVFAVPKS